MSLPDWPRAHGVSLFAATIRTIPAEFDVTEELGFTLSGDGEHDYLFVEKTGTNSEWLARQLAAYAGVPATDIGYAGLKDRHAVSRQWFSVPRWNQPDWAAFDLENVTVLETTRNARKLRRGAHKRNRFRIVVRGDVTNVEAIEKRLRTIGQDGVPNYFGPQRFGRDGANVDLANRWAAGKRLPRHKRSIAISTARSFLFNRQLAVRVVDHSWNTLIPGEVANLDGTGSVFDITLLDDELKARCAAMDIHPTGLLCGDSDETESAAADHGDWLRALRKARIRSARRSLRLRVIDLQWQFGTGALTLTFALSRGSFATTVLRELVTIDN